MNLVIKLTGSRGKNSLNVSKCSLEENLSSSHRAQSADNQNKALLRPAEPQQKVKVQSHRMSAVKVMTFIGKDWDPETWDGDVWADY